MSDNRAVRHRERKTTHRGLMQVFMEILPASQDPDVAKRQTKTTATLAKKARAAQSNQPSEKRKAKKRSKTAVA